ncbi:MAG: hypothetical protein ACO26G_07180, partial [Rickettsiales bacterium]
MLKKTRDKKKVLQSLFSIKATSYKKNSYERLLIKLKKVNILSCYLTPKISFILSLKTLLVSTAH